MMLLISGNCRSACVYLISDCSEITIMWGTDVFWWDLICLLIIQNNLNGTLTQMAEMVR